MRAEKGVFASTSCQFALSAGNRGFIEHGSIKTLLQLHALGTSRSGGKMDRQTLIV
jgi:hypothetical protein